MREGLDLFGQVVVTWPEIIEWVRTVAGIEPDSPRFAGYVRAWSVPEKIAAAKLAKEPPARRATRPGKDRSRIVKER